eukprot:13031642-Alexandrium_andersonii.AAC.1
MSASLVGSEMCIRDRGRTRRDMRSCIRSRISPDFPQAVQHAKWRSATAVSYTHLTLPTICSV